MLNLNRSNSYAQNNNLYLKAKVNLRSKRQNIHSLMKRLKDKRKKEIKEKYIFMVTVISVFVISGILISF